MLHLHVSEANKLSGRRGIRRGARRPARRRTTHALAPRVPRRRSCVRPPCARRRAGAFRAVAASAPDHPSAVHAGQSLRGACPRASGDGWSSSIRCARAAGLAITRCARAPIAGRSSHRRSSCRARAPRPRPAKIPVALRPGCWPAVCVGEPGMPGRGTCWIACACVGFLMVPRTPSIRAHRSLAG